MGGTTFNQRTETGQAGRRIQTESYIQARSRRESGAVWDHRFENGAPKPRRFTSSRRLDFSELSGHQCLSASLGGRRWDTASPAGLVEELCPGPAALLPLRSHHGPHAEGRRPPTKARARLPPRLDSLGSLDLRRPRQGASSFQIPLILLVSKTPSSGFTVFVLCL